MFTQNTYVKNKITCRSIFNLYSGNRDIMVIANPKCQSDEKNNKNVQVLETTAINVK